MKKASLIFSVVTLAISAGIASAQSPVCDFVLTNPHANRVEIAACMAAKTIEDSRRSFDDVYEGRERPRNDVQRAIARMGKQEREAQEWNRRYQEDRARERRDAVERLERQPDMQPYELDLRYGGNGTGCHWIRTENGERGLRPGGSSPCIANK